MPKLSEIDPKHVEVVEAPSSNQLKLSAIRPDDIEVVETPNPRKKFTAFESGLAGAAQGLSFGFADEIDAGLLAAVDKLKKGGNYGDLYRARRDEQREALHQTQSDNPAPYLAGALGGSVASSAVPVLSIAKGATVAGGLAKATGLGALSAAGLSDVDPTKSPHDAKEFAKDVAKGAGTGFALQGAGTIIGNAGRALTPKALRSYAEKRALTASGFMQKDLNKMPQSQIDETARQLLDKKVVTAFAGLEKISERAGELKKSAGAQIGSALGKVDDLVSTVKAQIDAGKIFKGISSPQKESVKKVFDDNFQFSMKRVGDRIQSELVEPSLNNPILEGEVRKLKALAKSFGKRGAQTLKAGNAIKSSQGQSTKFVSETIPEGFKKDVYRIIKEELENSVAKTGDLQNGLAATAGGNVQIGLKAPIKNALNEYKDAKSVYGAMAKAEKVAKARSGAVNANRTVSPSDYIAGAAGMIQGGPAQAVALGALNKIARRFGASLQAVSAEKLANGLEKVLAKSPELLKRFGPEIEIAAKNGNKSLVAVHYQLMKDPDYNAIMVGEESPLERRLKAIKENKGPQGSH